MTKIQRFPNQPAPWHSCIRCMKGDTETFFVVYGDGEWTAGVLCAVVGLEDDHAISTVEVIRKEGDTPWEARHPAIIRLCPACAEKGKVTPMLYSAAEIEQVQTEGGALRAFNQTDEVMEDYERWRREKD